VAEAEAGCWGHAAVLAAALADLETLLSGVVPPLEAMDEGEWECVQPTASVDAADTSVPVLPAGYRVCVTLPATLDATAVSDPAWVAAVTAAARTITHSLHPTLTAAWHRLKELTLPKPAAAHPLAATIGKLGERLAAVRRRCAALGLDLSMPLDASVAEARHRPSSVTRAVAQPPAPVATVVGRKRPHSLCPLAKPKKRSLTVSTESATAPADESFAGSRRSATAGLDRALVEAGVKTDTRRWAEIVEAELCLRCPDVAVYRNRLRRVRCNIAHVAARLVNGSLTPAELVMADASTLASDEVRVKRRTARAEALEAVASACMVRSEGQACRHCGGEYLESVVITQGQGKGHPVSLLRCGACHRAQ